MTELPAGQRCSAVHFLNFGAVFSVTGTRLYSDPEPFVPAAAALAAPAPVISLPAPVASTPVDERPKPPPDLDARLVQHYPLRGLVLNESGLARLPFTVDPSGVVRMGEALAMTRPEYAVACRRMPEGTIWTPARVSGAAVPFTSVFDCRFEQLGSTPKRSVVPAAIAQPPVPPNYGERWWDRHAEGFATQDSSAQLRFRLDIEGRVHVNSVVSGSDPIIAKACTGLLEQGPPWTPAKDANGAAVPFEDIFTCTINVKGSRPSLRLHTKQIGASGPIAGEQVARVVSERLQELAHCLGMASRSASPMGQHWLAFEIRPDGTVGRVEWVEGAVTDPTSDACLIDAVHRWRFPAAPERTIADVELYISTYESAFD